MTASPPGETAHAAVGRPRRFDADTEIRMIVEATLTLLRRNDFEDVTVAAILEESSLSTRSFYRHFSSKDELLCAMYRDNAERAAARLVAATATADTPRRAVQAWVDECLGLAYDRRRAERVAIFDSASARRAVGYEEVSREAVEGLTAPLVGILERGLVDG